MKIPKTIVSRDASVLEAQALALSEEVLSSAESSFIGSENNPLRRAQQALSADYILPVTRPSRVRPGDRASADPFNDFFRSVRLDLLTVERTGKAIAELMRSGHNVVSTEENGLVADLKVLRERLTALKLYSFDTLGETDTVRYSFGVGERVTPVSGSALATVNQEEGILTLPVKSQTKIEIDTVSIEDGSNGFVGNSRERERPPQSNIALSIDGNDITWFEYEKIVSQRSNIPLRLILKLVPKESGVINKIVINPVNLGTSNWIKIEDIQISTGGRFSSLKDELKGASWSGEDPFSLSPANSRYANQGIFSFSPRFVDAVIIKLRQDEPYPIENGRNLRYAIGIRELELYRVAYEPEAEFALEATQFNRPVVGIGILENLFGKELDLFDSSYKLSLDGGSDWVDVAPLDNIDSSTTEALFLSQPLASLMLRGKLTRNSEAFLGQLSQGPEANTVEESLVNVGAATTSTIPLLNKPKTFLEVIRTGFANRGDRQGVFIGTVSRGAGVEESFSIPFAPEDSFTLRAGSRILQRVAAFQDEDTEGFVYNQNSVPPMITLAGAKPPSGTDLFMIMQAVTNPLFEESSGGFVIRLREQSDKIKNLTSLYSVEPVWQDRTKASGPGTNYIQLPDYVPQAKWYLTGLADETYEYDPGEDYIDFIDGVQEFNGIEEKKFSVDQVGNRVYWNGNSTSDDGDTTLSYRSPKWVEVPPKSWHYHNTENAIVGASPLISAKNATVEIAAMPTTRLLRLAPEGWEEGIDFSIAKGSIRGTNLNGVAGISRTLANEIDYIDGSTEFEDYLNALGGLGYFSVNYKLSTIHLPRQAGIAAADRGFLPGRIDFKYISLSVKHGVGGKLQEGVDYKVRGNSIELTPSFSRTIQSVSRTAQSGTVAHVRYDAIAEAQIDGQKIEEFYSPIIRDIAIIGVATDPRLSTLERI